MALIIFRSDLLFGSQSYWATVPADNAANWIGYEYFARDSWHWPLLQTTLLAPPAGVNAAFADPIPGLALIGKIVFHSTGYLPNYFGLWLLFSYGMQSLFAYLIARELGMKSLPAILVCALCLLVPAFIFRYGHFALLNHFLVLAALYFYIRIVARGYPKDLWIAALLTGSLVLVNPYILVMASAVFYAGIGQATLQKKAPYRLAAIVVGLQMAVVLILALSLGMIEFSKPVPASGGFGLYSMNLLSPITPQLSALPGRANYILDATQGQYEGYNYFGVGILLLIALALIVGWRSILKMVREHAVLVAFVSVMAVYSLSSKVYAGEKLLFTVPIEKIGVLFKFTQIFRSSGRFFWQFAYVVFFGVIILLYQRLQLRRFVVLAVTALLLQAVDVRPLIKSVQNRAQPAPLVIDRSLWSTTIQHHSELLIVPQFLCTNKENRRYIYQLELLSAHFAIPTNAAIINRLSLDCSTERNAAFQDLRGLAVTPDPLIVLFKNEIGPFLPYQSIVNGLTCRDVNFAYVCSSHSNDSAFSALGKNFDPLFPQLSFGQRVATAEGGPGPLFFGRGWSVPGEHATWGVTEQSDLDIKLNHPVCGDFLFRADIMPFGFKDYLVRSAQVRVNSRAIGRIDLNGPGEQQIEMRIPNTGCHDYFHIEFVYGPVKSPQQVGLNDDPRPVNWAMFWFSIAKAKARVSG